MYLVMYCYKHVAPPLYCYKHVAPLGLMVYLVFVIRIAINISPLWGFDVFGYPYCYKHVAPLGLWLLGHAARL